MTNKSILFLLGSLLSGEGNEASGILNGLSEKHDWNKLVYLASGQLVFPALFLKLSDKKYSHQVPPALLDYLAHTYKLNHSRNKKIIAQAREVNKLLRARKIKPVFLKGTAYLFSNLHPGLGDRLVGDIDLLVEENQFGLAAKTLMAAGYKTPLHGKPETHYFTKHYPRLVHNEQIAAVEIHLLPVNYEYSFGLKPEHVISEAHSAQKDKNILTPSNEHMLIHSFIHSQLANKAQIYKRIHLRDILDFCLLQKRMGGKKPGIHPRLKTRFENYRLLVEELTGTNCSFPLSYRLFRKQIFLNLDSLTFRKIHTTTIFLIQLFPFYFKVFLRAGKSKSYRKNLLEKAWQTEVWKNHFRNLYVNGRKR